MSVLRLALSVFLVAVGLGLALQFFGGFRVDESPEWHVGLVYMDVFLFGLVPFLTAAGSGPSRMEGCQSAALGAVVVSLAMVLMFAWVFGGPPTGFRDERIVPLTAMFVCTGSVGVCLINLTSFAVELAAKRGLLRGR